MTESLYCLTNLSLFPPPPAPGTYFFYSCDFFLNPHISDTMSYMPFSGLFHLA